MGTSSIKLIQSRTSDSRTLSLITEGASCRDISDANGRYSNVSLDIGVPLLGDGPGSLTIDVRGGLARTEESTFGLVRLQAAGQSLLITSDETMGSIAGRLNVSVNSPSLLTLSILMLANAGKAEHGESLVAVDSLDLELVT